MAIKYTGFYNPNYKGLMVGMRSSMCKPSNQPPTTMPLRVIWNDYLTTAPASATLVGVAINLNQQQIVTPLDSVQSVTIDNLNVPYQVTLRADDYDYEIQCPANGIITKPVITNGLKFTLFMQKVPPFADNPVIGQVTGTILYMNNFNMFPDDPLQSVGLQQIANIPGSAPNFVNPVIGNLRVYFTYDVNTGVTTEADRFAAGAVTELFQNVRPIYGSSGTVIITSVNAFFSHIIAPAPATALPETGNTQRFGIQVIADGVPAKGFFAYTSYASSTRQTNVRMQDISNIYVPLPLSSNYTFNTNLPTGVGYGQFCFDARFAVIN